jgi:hypothetical protein
MNTTNNMNPTVNVLMLGGPVDGQMYCVGSRERVIRVPAMKEMTANGAATRPNSPTNVAEHIYTIDCIVDVSSVHRVGKTDLNMCAVRQLVGAYRRPTPHITEGSIAENMIMLLGGDADGHRVLMVDGHDRYRLKADTYQVIRLTGTDRKSYRVGVLDMIGVDPIALLIDGYRK